MPTHKRLSLLRSYALYSCAVITTLLHAIPTYAQSTRSDLMQQENYEALSTADYIARYTRLTAEVRGAKKPEQLHERIKKNGTSLLIGSTLGFISGKLSGLLGQDSLGLFWVAVHYSLWSSLRNTLTEMVINDLEETDTPHNTPLLRSATKVADWVTMLRQLLGYQQQTLLIVL